MTTYRVDPLGCRAIFTDVALHRDTAVRRRHEAQESLQHLTNKARHDELRGAVERLKDAFGVTFDSTLNRLEKAIDHGGKAVDSIVAGDVEMARDQQSSASKVPPDALPGLRR